MEIVPVSFGKKSPLITQSNHLTEARYSLTVAEQRLVLTMLSFIAPDDCDFKEYEIKVLDFKTMLGINTNAVYDQFRDTLKTLASRVIYIPQGKNGKDYLISHWFSSAQYDSSRNSVKISFDKKLKPYLLELKEQFTKYRLFVIAQFKSSYTIRIYMLLKQYETLGFREFDLDDLKNILDIDAKSYDDFKRFRSRVINQAKKEFETKNKETGGYMSDITFDLETIRTGRKITRLRFNIKKQSYQERLPIDLPEAGIQEFSESPAREALEKYGIKDDIAQRYLDQQEESEILRCVTLLERAIGAGKVKSSNSGYLLKLLEKRAGQETEAEKQAQKKKQEKQEQCRKANEEEQKQETRGRLSDEFFRMERKKWLATLSKEEKEVKLQEALESMGGGYSVSMVKDLESPLIIPFIKSQIAGYEEKRSIYLQEQMQ